MKKLLKRLLSLSFISVLVLSLFSCKSGKVLRPLYNDSFASTDSAIYPCSFSGDSINGENESYLNIDIYSEDIYDVVEIQDLKVGDSVEKAGEIIKIDKLVWDDQKSTFCINSTDTIEDAPELFVPNEGGTYRVQGFDDHATYTKRATKNLKIASNCVLKDSSDLDNPEKNIYGVENIKNYIKSDELGFNFLNTTAHVENNEIVEIKRVYIP